MEAPRREVRRTRRCVRGQPRGGGARPLTFARVAAPAPQALLGDRLGQPVPATAQRCSSSACRRPRRRARQRPLTRNRLSCWSRSRGGFPWPPSTSRPSRSSSMSAECSFGATLCPRRCVGAARGQRSPCHASTAPASAARPLPVQPRGPLHARPAERPRWRRRGRGPHGGVRGLLRDQAASRLASLLGAAPLLPLPLPHVPHRGHADPVHVPRPPGPQAEAGATLLHP